VTVECCMKQVKAFTFARSEVNPIVQLILLNTVLKINRYSVRYEEGIQR
jgi:hypothetical protein